MRGFLVFSLGKAFANQWSQALRESDQGYEANQKYGVGEGYSGKFRSAHVPDHNIVGKLYHHLSGLCNHNREGDFQISFIEG